MRVIGITIICKIFINKYIFLKSQNYKLSDDCKLQYWVQLD